MAIKKKVLIVLMFIASCLFLYQGFSLLFHDKETVELTK